MVRIAGLRVGFIQLTSKKSNIQLESRCSLRHLTGHLGHWVKELQESKIQRVARVGSRPTNPAGVPNDSMNWTELSKVLYHLLEPLRYRVFICYIYPTPRRFLTQHQRWKLKIKNINIIIELLFLIFKTEVLPRGGGCGGKRPRLLKIATVRSFFFEESKCSISQ